MKHTLMFRLGLVECPWCTQGAKGRATFKGHWGYRACFKRGRVHQLALQRRQRAENGVPAAATLAGAGDSLQLFSHVLEFLSACTWPDGTSRATGTVLLLTEDGRWKVWLHDRDGGESLWLSGVTLDEVLLAAEAALESGQGDWRPYKPSKGGGGGKRT